MSVVKNNRFTFFMIAFVLLFYALALSGEKINRGVDEPSKMEKSEAIFTVKEIKEKEDNFKQNIQSHPVLIGVTALFFMAVILFGFFLDVYLVNKKLKGQDFIAKGLPHHPVLWGIKDVGQVFIFLFFVEALVLTVEFIGCHFVRIQDVKKHFFLMLNSLIRDIAVAGFVIFLVVRRFKHKLSSIGFTSKNFLKNIGLGVIGYFAIIPGILIVLFILSYAAQTFSYEPPVQPVVQIYLKETGHRPLLFFTLFVAILGPVIEEIFFRGFSYKAFRQKLGVRWALVASAAIFSGLHMNVIAFFPIFFLGVFLAYLYEATGSLVPSMTVHMIHNLIMVTMTLMFKSFSN